MKTLILLCVAFAALVSCQKDDKPAPTTTVAVTTTVAPTTTQPTGTPIPADYSCNPGGMTLSCGNPVWFNLPKCSDSGDGDTVYFKSAAAMIAFAKIGNVDSCINIDGKPSGYTREGGLFGPCIPCTSIGLKAAAKKLNK